MGKFNFQGLARAVKIPVNRVWGAAQSVATAMNTTAIAADNLQRPGVPFRLAFNMPVVNGEFFSDNLAPQIELCFPFVLPELIDQNIAITMQSVMLSYEQAAENCGIEGQSTLSSLVGVRNGAWEGKYDLNIRISEKIPSSSPGSPVDNCANADTWSAFAPTGLAAAQLQPWLWSGLAVPLDQSKTYVLRISAPGLATDRNDRATWAALCSLQVELNFLAEAITRDSGDTVQNIPTSNLGVAAGDTILLNTPVGGDLIKTGNSNVKGLDGMLRIFDKKLFDGVTGGFNSDGSLPPAEQLSTSAGYEAFAVPLWCSATGVGRISADNIDDIAGILTLAGDGAAVDKRIIPLPWPMTVHRVFLMVNYGAPPVIPAPAFSGAVLPSSVTLEYVAHVRLLTGIQGELQASQTVAFKTIHPATEVPYDAIKQRANGVLVKGSTYDMALYEIELADPARPFYVGRASTRQMARQNVANYGGPDAAPLTQGCEQFLEVSLAMSDANGMGTVVNGGAALVPEETYIGTGGAWIYIIGKKTIMGGSADLDV